MKNRYLFPLLAAVIACLIAVVCPTAHAAGLAPDSASFHGGAILLAQATAPTSQPFYTTTEFWTAIFALATGLVAVWRNNLLTQHQKVNQALVLSIEAASKIPEVVAAEEKFKTLISDKATQLGIEPLLNRLVKDLTVSTPTEPVAASPNQ